MNSIGPYEIRGKLGQGAMAVVWRGWDPILQREVAIKEPLDLSKLESRVSTELRNRFLQEGHASARLNHPNIITVYSAQAYDGRPVIVMELLKGKTLADLIDSHVLTLQAALNIADQLLDALGYAHSMGVVHRDVKPDNIYVSPEGFVTLTDFGVAHIVSSAGQADMVVAGSPGYMSPEQLVGRANDGRSDIFSVGVLMYEMITGSNPFGSNEGCSREEIVLRTTMSESLPSLKTSVSPEVADVVKKALSQNPQSRYASAQEMRRALSRAVESNPTMDPVTDSEVTVGSDPLGGTDLSTNFSESANPGKSILSIVVFSLCVVAGVIFILTLLSNVASTGIAWVIVFALGIAAFVWYLYTKSASNTANDVQKMSYEVTAVDISQNVRIMIDNAGGSYEKSVSLPAVIGRAMGSDILVNDSQISRDHARLRWDGQRLCVEDLQSSNGVFVKGERISGRRVIGVGGQFVAGDTVFTILKGTDDEF